MQTHFDAQIHNLAQAYAADLQSQIRQEQVWETQLPQL